MAGQTQESYIHAETPSLWHQGGGLTGEPPEAAMVKGAGVRGQSSSATALPKAAPGGCFVGTGSN